MGTNQVHYFRDLVGIPSRESQNSNFLADYIYQAGQLVAEYKNNTTYFPHPDHLGSTRLVTALNQSVRPKSRLSALRRAQFPATLASLLTNSLATSAIPKPGLDHTWFRQ